LKNLKNNNCELKLKQDVKNISKNKENLFEIETNLGEKYFSKNLIISSG
jgi:hypothetical protein